MQRKFQRGDRAWIHGGKIGDEYGVHLRGGPHLLHYGDEVRVVEHQTSFDFAVVQTDPHTPCSRTAVRAADLDWIHPTLFKKGWRARLAWSDSCVFVPLEIGSVSTVAADQKVDSPWVRLAYYNGFIEVPSELLSFVGWESFELRATLTNGWGDFVARYEDEGQIKIRPTEGGPRLCTCPPEYFSWNGLGCRCGGA